MQGQNVRLGVVLERDALAPAEQALVGAASHAGRQPHALAALFVGHGIGRIEVHREVVGLACRFQRVDRVPVVRGAKRNPGLVHGFPAFLQVALVIDAHAPDVVRPAVVSAAPGKASGLLTHAHLARIGLAEKAHLLAAFVGYLAAAHGCGVVRDVVPRLLRELLDEGLEFVHLASVAFVDIMTDTHFKAQLERAQVVDDAVKGGAAARKAARRVMRGPKAIYRDLRGRDFVALKHVSDLLREQITVGDDARIVFGAAFLGKGHKASRERVDYVRCQKRLAAKPGHVDVLCAGSVNHARGQSRDVVLHLSAHLAATVILKAVGAIKVATHRGANREPDAPPRPARRAAHRLKRRALIEVCDDAALGKAFDDGMIFVKLVKHREQIHLDRSVFGTVALEEIGNGHHLRAGDRRTEVVTGHMPAGLARRTRCLSCGVLVLAHVSLLLLRTNHVVRLYALNRKPSPQRLSQKKGCPFLFLLAITPFTSTFFAAKKGSDPFLDSPARFGWRGATM